MQLEYICDKLLFLHHLGNGPVQVVAEKNWWIAIRISYFSVLFNNIKQYYILDIFLKLILLEYGRKWFCV